MGERHTAVSGVNESARNAESKKSEMVANRKRKKSRKRRKLPRGKGHTGHVFSQHPFSDIPREMLLPTIIQHAKASKITFRESLDHTRRTVYVMAKGSPFDIRHNAAREPSTQRRFFGLA